MAADLHIHIIENDEIMLPILRKWVVQTFSSWDREHGNRYGFHLFKLKDGRWVCEQKLTDADSEQLDIQKEIYLNLSEEDVKLVEDSPNCWIGAVSWLKAALFEDQEQYIPPTVAQISELVGWEFPVIDDAFIAKVRLAFREKKVYMRRNKWKYVKRWLKLNKGKRVYRISW